MLARAPRGHPPLPEMFRALESDVLARLRREEAEDGYNWNQE